MAPRTLAPYRRKRDFTRTAEPSGEQSVAASNRLRFVVQKHDASHLHFDLRLEHDGVFKSWAVPKGPSPDPHTRRLAMAVEDHPLDYGDFEGTIPKGQYGGGTVMLWDRGYWAPEPGFEDVGAALEKGELKFVAEGERMHGGWVLVRTRPDKQGRASWLLIKHHDAAAVDHDGEALAAEDSSVASGRSMAEIAAGVPHAVTPFMTAKAARKPAGRPAKARSMSRLPDFIAPQLTQPVDAPPAGPGWAHEIKFDGYRIQMRVQGGEARLLTRKGLDWTDRFPEIARAGTGLPDCILDGEVVALDQDGAPDFAALQAAIAERRTADLVFFVFDQMASADADLRPLPLEARKASLRNLLKGAPADIRYVDHFPVAGEAVLQSACRMHLEGVVSKRLDAPYVSGRGPTWTKSKCRAGHEVVIGGYVTTGKAFRSLIAGVNRDGRLVHVGRIGTGFGRAKVDRLMPKLKALETDQSPFSGVGAPRKTADTHWVRPDLVAEIEYEGFTADGRLRQAAFKGLREDKPAAEVEAERPAPVDKPLSQPAQLPAGSQRRRGAYVMGVTLTHPDKALWPDAGDASPVSKQDLADYYAAVGDWMLPHIRGRPCSMVRCPDGIEAPERFFQRHVGKGQSALITAVTVSGDRKPYLQFDRVEALAAAAQVAALELHPWNCRPFEPEQPGRLVFDLDPAPEVGFDRVIAAALDVRERLEALGLAAFCKTTGGKGLHVVTPLAPEGLDWPAAKAFAHALCDVMAADAPGRYLTVMTKSRRTGRIFLDYLRNDRMSTAVAPLSPRARPGATVSMPLTWDLVNPGLDPKAYTVRTAPALLRKLSPWDDYDAAERSLATAISRLHGG